MAIFTKHGKEIDSKSVRTDGECYQGRTLVKIWAVIKGHTAPKTYYISDLTADDGRREIEGVVRSNAKRC